MYSPHVTCLCIYRNIKVPLPFNAAFTLLSWKVSSPSKQLFQLLRCNMISRNVTNDHLFHKKILTVQKSVIFVLLFIYSYKNLYCG